MAKRRRHSPKKRETVGSDALKKRLAEWGAAANLAKELGVTPDVISRWISGERTPTAVQRAKLQDKFRIGWRTWDQELPESDAAQGRPGPMQPMRSRAFVAGAQ